MLNIPTGQGNCGKCGQPRIDVNGIIQCIVCDAPAPTSTLVVDTPDRGEAEMKRVLARHGIVAPPPSLTGHPNPEKQKAAVAAAPALVTPAPADFGATIDWMIGVLKTLPMPNDIKQFKQVTKIRTLLEGLKSNG